MHMNVPIPDIGAWRIALQQCQLTHNLLQRSLGPVDGRSIAFLTVLFLHFSSHFWGHAMSSCLVKATALAWVLVVDVGWHEGMRLR